MPDHRVLIVVLVAAPLLAGCTGPASDGMDGEAGFVGHRVEVVTRFSAEDYPDRHEEGDMADGAPAREGVVGVGLSDITKEGNPPTDPGCETSYCEEVAPADAERAYQVPMEKDVYYYPLGSDGTVILYFAGNLTIGPAVEGEGPGPDECGTRTYGSSDEHIESDPDVRQGYQAFRITQDTDFTIPFGVRCSERGTA